MSNDSHYAALVISPDGTVEQVDIPHDDETKAWYEYTGCSLVQGVYGHIYVYPDTDGADVALWSDEEAKIHGKAPNGVATGLWWTVAEAARSRDYLCGVVVVTGGADENGKTLPVPARIVEMMEQAGAL